MLKNTTLNSVIVCALLFSWRADAGRCKRDRDCKGERICERQRCVWPRPPVYAPPPVQQQPQQPTVRVRAAPVAPSAPPAQVHYYIPQPALASTRTAVAAYAEQGNGSAYAGAAQPPPHWGAPAVAMATQPPEYTGLPRFFQRGYGVIGVLIRTTGWIGAYEGGDPVQTPALGMGYWAGYGVISERLHLGGYLSYAEDEGMKVYGLGFTLKAGGRVGRRVWLGFAGDIGGVSEGAVKGVRIFPRLHMDIVVADTENFRLNLLGSLGTVVSPALVHADSKDVFWQVEPSMMIGAALGI